jgi:hypothetical protein
MRSWTLLLIAACCLSACDRPKPFVYDPKPTKVNFARSVFAEIEVGGEKILLSASLDVEVDLRLKHASGKLFGILSRYGLGSNSASSARALLEQEAQRVVAEAHPGLDRIFIDTTGLFN